MKADEKKSKKPMSLKMQMKMIIRLFVDILKTAWEVVENCYTRDPKQNRKIPDVGVTAAEKFSRESCKEMTTCSCYSLQLRKNRRGGGC